MPAPLTDPVPLPLPFALERGLALLARAAPQAFPHWLACQHQGAACYAAETLDNCSVPGHAMAACFAHAIQPFLRGRVLDLGCGPQAVPSYLEGYPVALLAGLDPLPPATPHPFVFAQGVAEVIPWPAETFDVVVAATSLDHVLLLDAVLREVRRVLRPGGRFVVWCGLVPHAPTWEARLGTPSADGYHLFQLGDWFPPLVVQSGFTLERETHPVLGYRGDFYIFSRHEEATL